MSKQHVIALRTFLSTCQKNTKIHIFAEDRKKWKDMLFAYDLNGSWKARKKFLKVWLKEEEEEGE